MFARFVADILVGGEMVGLRVSQGVGGVAVRKVVSVHDGGLL